MSAEWPRKKAHIQGVAVFQGRDYTYKYVEFLKNSYNAVDETFYDAINVVLLGY